MHFHPSSGKIQYKQWPIHLPFSSAQCMWYNNGISCHGVLLLGLRTRTLLNQPWFKSDSWIEYLQEPQEYRRGSCLVTCWWIKMTGILPIVELKTITNLPICLANWQDCTAMLLSILKLLERHPFQICCINWVVSSWCHLSSIKRNPSRTSSKNPKKMIYKCGGCFISMLMLIYYDSPVSSCFNPTKLTCA